MPAPENLPHGQIVKEPNHYLLDNVYFYKLSDLKRGVNEKRSRER